jgi:hypothetical protein
VAAAPAPPPADVVASLVNPVAGRATNTLDDGPPELPPQPVQQRTRAIVRTKSSKRLELGDLVCSFCGEGNLPTRSFCSRCGEPLEHAGVVRPVWWRRIFRRRRKQMRAGTRPGEKGTGRHRRWIAYSAFRKVRYILAALLILLAIVYAFYPPFQATVRDNFLVLFHKVEPSLQPVHPTRITASTQVKDHTGDAVADEYTDTYWESPFSGQVRTTLTFTFNEHVILRSIILRSGANDDFVDNGRPSILRVTFSNGRTTTLTPEDTSAAQTLSLDNATLVDSVTMQVADVYDGRHYRDVAISEIEFYALK